MKGWSKSVGLLVAWLLVFGMFAVFVPESFLSWTNFETILRQTITVAFAAVGMTLIIITGAIDLSVGSLVALITVVMAVLLKQGADPLVASAAGIGAGCVAGLLNGVLLTRLKVGSFIVTLATLLAFRGAAKGLANEKSIATSLNWLGSLTGALPKGQKWMLLAPGGWLAVLVACGAGFLLHKTAFGRHLVATGSNEATARMCGVNVDRVRLAVFAIAGLCFGLAGVMMYSRLTIGDPTAAGGLELTVIAAVVIGGASLSGGEGSIVGSLLGALIMTTIATGGAQLQWPNWVQEIVTGAIILGAVALDRFRQARAMEKATE